MDPIATVGARVADGLPVDWPAHEAKLKHDPVARRLLEQLKVIAAIADVHRRALHEKNHHPD